MFNKIKEIIRKNKIKENEKFKNICITVKIDENTYYLELFKEDGYGMFGEVTRIRPRLYAIDELQRLMIYEAKNSFSDHSSIHAIVNEFRKEYRMYLREEKINMHIKDSGIII